jgi:acyl-coenzyme A thioesterase PaaI-like protein
VTLGMGLSCTQAELQDLLAARVSESARLITDLPAYAENEPRSMITALEAGRLGLTTRWDPNAGRPGGTWSGPSQFEIIDTAGFLLTMAHLPPDFDALTISLSLQFLHAPPAGDISAEARLLRMTGRTSVITVELSCEAVAGPLAHSTVSYACRARTSAQALREAGHATDLSYTK